MDTIANNMEQKYQVYEYVQAEAGLDVGSSTRSLSLKRSLSSQ